jgi:hypothetical protein
MNVSMINTIRATERGRSPARAGQGWRVGLLVAVAALGLTLGGCGGSSSDSDSASGGSSSDDSAVRYAQCMRENGVPGFPDPVNGQLQLNASPGGALDPSSPQFQAAQQACKSLEPPGLTGGGQDTQQQNQILAFAACMRDNGVPDFPDPQGGLFTGGGVDPNSPEFQSAMAACRNLLPGGVATGGQ